MSTDSSVEVALVQWGDRLFYPPNRIVRTPTTPRLDTLMRQRAAVIRARIVATVTRRAPQVMVKVTGGGRGMAAIAAHFRYISKNGQLEIEDERGVGHRGKESMRDLVDQWRHGGAFIPEEGHRREAFNVMLSMPRGTDPLIVQRAARDFAAVELNGHRYAMVLHEHQANPHVHLSVRATARDGTRLNPRKADLHRWRETFAERLRAWGVQAEASRQATRGENRQFEALWQVKAKNDGRLEAPRVRPKSGARYTVNRKGAIEAWARIADALRHSGQPEDLALARDIVRFVGQSRFFGEQFRAQQHEVPARARPGPEPVRGTGQQRGPDIEWGR